ncbi:hypothetical protein CBR_g23992 [Chara braunii]|uniref:Uncharacterized protein n=1 Tax=Chara braunii TaxID=69332 RepID=A0A388L5H2_CHABU|nr:hypothetical protein CBR_g23992 [Chara braunii]|eukprot:GBG77547.1 hypothetical protein CBR_g23992 [Chara braunii]
MRDSTLDVLPPEMIMRMLSLLSPSDWARAAQTCRFLRSACDDLLGTARALDLRHAGAAMDSKCFASVARKLGPNLRRLDLDCSYLRDEAMELLPPTLSDVALTGCDHHTDALLVNLGERLGPNLLRFAFSGFGGAISRSGFEALITKCPNLTCLCVDGNGLLDTNAIVRAAAATCHNLSELSTYDLTLDTFRSLKSKYKVSLRAFRHKKRRSGGLSVGDQSMRAIVDVCPQLEELNLIDKSDGSPSAEWDPQSTTLTDSGILLLTLCAETLTSLKLGLSGRAGNERCSEVAVMQLMSECKKLVHVELSNFRRLTDPPVYELIQCHPALVELCLDAAPITNTCLEAIGQNCPRLRILSVKFCKKLTEKGLISLRNCRWLESLNLGQTNGVTDTSVSALCSHLPRLKSLVLNYGLLSDNALRAIARCSEMQDLALHGCSHVTSNGLRTLASGCPRLRFLCLSNCEHITDSGVVAIAKACPFLLKVRLDGCRLLSNPSVRALAQHAPRLRDLSMQHCPKLSDGVFGHLLGASSLRFLDLGRGKLSGPAVSGFRRSRPNVEIHLDGTLYDITLEPYS